MDAETVVRLCDVARWLHGKWYSDIVAELVEGPRRSQELFLEVRRRETDNRGDGPKELINKSVFYKTLDQMVRCRLILKHQEGSSLRKTVWYELSPELADFLEVDTMDEMAAWVDAHRDFLDEVERRRQQHDAP